jgi:hypothetical protein
VPPKALLLQVGETQLFYPYQCKAAIKHCSVIILLHDPATNLVKLNTPLRVALMMNNVHQKESSAPRYCFDEELMHFMLFSTAGCIQTSAIEY